MYFATIIVAFLIVIKQVVRKVMRKGMHRLHTVFNTIASIFRWFRHDNINLYGTQFIASQRCMAKNADF